MYLTPFATATIVALTGLAAAAPSVLPPNSTDFYASPAFPATNATDLEKRKAKPTILVTYCEHSEHQGACYTQAFPQEQCYNMAPWYRNRISSIYIQKYKFCDLHPKINCDGDRTVKLAYPGSTNLNKYKINDQISSIACDSMETHW